RPRVIVAEHDRAVGAHEVQVLVAVDVPDARALAAREEVRVGAGYEHGRRLVAVDAARDDGERTREEGLGLAKAVRLHGTPSLLSEVPIEELVHRPVGALIRVAAPILLEGVGSTVQDEELRRLPG